MFVATCTPLHITKNLAAAVAQGLNSDAAGFDLRAGGAGGLEAWIAGAGAVAAGAQRVLVVASEASSHYANPEDLPNALLFGDGAAALVLGPAGESNPSKGTLLFARSGTASVAGMPFTVPGRLPPVEPSIASGMYRFQRPDDRYKRGLEKVWESAAQHVLADLAEAKQQAASLLPYGVSRPQLEALASSVQLPVDAALSLLRERGCLGSAGALALVAQHIAHSAPAEQAQVIASLAVGGGISWCSLAWLG